MMFKRWDNTAYSGTHTHTDTHTHMHNKKTTGCNYRHTGSGRDVYSAFFRRCIFLLALDSDLQFQTNRTLLEQHTTKQDKYDKYATCACARQLLVATCH